LGKSLDDSMFLVFLITLVTYARKMTLNCVFLDDRAVLKWSHIKFLPMKNLFKKLYLEILCRNSLAFSREFMLSSEVSNRYCYGCY